MRAPGFVSPLPVSVVEGDSARDPQVEPISLERAHLLVSGLHHTMVRALVRGEELDRAPRASS